MTRQKQGAEYCVEHCGEFVCKTVSLRRVALSEVVPTNDILDGAPDPPKERENFGWEMGRHIVKCIGSLWS